MLSSFAAVMTFGCRPPVSHGLAANAAPAAGRQPRLRSVCQPPLLVYTCILKEGAFEKKKKIPGNRVKPPFFLGSVFQTVAQCFTGGKVSEIQHVEVISLIIKAFLYSTFQLLTC